jgi:uncharacterized protein
MTTSKSATLLKLSASIRCNGLYDGNPKPNSNPISSRNSEVGSWKWIFEIGLGGMIVGSLRVRLVVRESRTLKDKRRVVQSIKDRLRIAFNISIAEVDSQDHRQLVVLGIAMVGNDSRQVTSALDQIVDNLRHHPIAELLDYEKEI